MKKLIAVLAVLVAALALAGVFILPGCMQPEKGEKGDKGEQGIQGEQGVQGEKGETGATGVGIDEVLVNGDGEFVIKLSNGQNVNLGSVKGDKGDKGDKGEAGKDGEDGEDGEDGTSVVSTKKIGTVGNVDTYEIVYSDGTKSTFTVTNGAKGDKGERGEKGEQGEQGIQGIQGEQGVQGETGATGVGIDSIVLNEDCELTIKLTNGTNLELGSIKGAKGDQGIQGEKGEQGEQGEQGIQGEQGEKGEQGEQGEKGESGTNGRTVEFRLEGDWIQWKYTDEVDWKNLYQKGETPISTDYVTVTYKLGGGAMPSGTPEYVNVTSGATVVLPTPAKNGYVFKGWYLTGEKYPVSQNYRVHESVVLTAKWEAGPLAAGKKIYTVSDIFEIADNLGGVYCLMNDIDCGGLGIPAIGTSAENSFRGLFEGQGYTISNFTVTGESNVGLFGYNTGTIRHLQLKDVKIEILSTSASTLDVGCLVGYNAGVVSRCSVTNGDVHVKVDCARRAGLISGENNGIIENCLVEGKVKVEQSSNNTNRALAGGVCGYNSKTITNCFSNVYLSSYGCGTYSSSVCGYAGFICARNDKNGSVTNCMIFGTLEVGSKARGDVCAENSGTVDNCYRDENLVIIPDNPNLMATAMARKNLNNPNFYKLSLTWDATIWNFDDLDFENYVYPSLRFEF